MKKQKFTKKFNSLSDLKELKAQVMCDNLPKLEKLEIKPGSFTIKDGEAIQVNK